MPVVLSQNPLFEKPCLYTTIGMVSLALRACAEEAKDGWSCLLQDLRSRGATQMDLIVTDGHEGLLTAVSALFSATLRQRCVVHKQRNVLHAIPHRERKEVSTE